MDSPLYAQASPASFKRNFTPTPPIPRVSETSPRPLSEIQTPQRRPSPPLPSLPPPADVPEEEARVVIAVDYGTTYTGVAYLLIQDKEREDEGEVLAGEIRVISEWAKTTADKVPSDYSYSPSLLNGCQQWGYDIDDHSRVIKWTKLALEDTGNRHTELQELSKLLWEMRTLHLTDELAIINDIPRHLSKEPEDIATDYIEKVAEKTLDEILAVGRLIPETIPVDMVITHPAKWSDKALNSTFRAITASFNEDLFPKIRNISFVSEPEACAHYTLREAWQKDHIRFRKNDCFIVCDAGGGTVDIASYKVASIDHNTKQIKLEQIGFPIGNKCGATFIDTSFTDFVRDRLGEEDWERLNYSEGQDNATGGHNIVKPLVRLLLERFQPIKHQFDGKGTKLGWPLQLPRGIGATDNAEKGIESGVLRITPDDLKDMFKQSVDKTLVLISQAVTHIDISERQLKLRKIFLSGGFGKSPYLFERVKQFGNTRRIDVERGEDCWAAVVKGAIIKSLGLYTEKLPFVRACPRDYGIKIRSQYAAYKHNPDEVQVDVEGMTWATDQIRWFIRNGDVIFPDKPLVMMYDCHWSMRASEFPGTQTKRSPGAPQPSDAAIRDVVFIASSESPAPTRFDALNPSSSQVLSLRCDLTKVPADGIAEYNHPKLGKYMKFWVRIEIRVFERVQVKVTSAGKTLCQQEIPL
ncbi:hypothetical protein QBC47DRAFT_383808 [Echria macrotheca]|uniref:Actin-like ATPase domain-containing protein n=1 Tax=Echria macrotheca TaxID=438768 RepID=A0AAJ0FAM2_9PEZI|nr:hypothetical protein QBC47DRAFT_383808 [Echria macrotheca]